MYDTAKLITDFKTQLYFKKRKRYFKNCLQLFYRAIIYLSGINLKNVYFIYLLILTLIGDL